MGSRHAGDFAGSGVGTIGFSALSGGIGEELGGGSFWHGAGTGAIVAGLNHLGEHALSQDPKHQPKQKPKDLDAFPGAKRVRDVGGRATWRTPDGSYLQWDSKKGEIEVYDKTGKIHKGGYDPQIPGKQISKRVPSRSMWKSVSPTIPVLPIPSIAPMPMPVMGPIFEPVLIPIIP